MPIKKLLKYIKKLEVNETLAVGIIFFILIILLSGVFYFQKENPKTSPPQEAVSKQQESAINESLPYNMPVLDLPLRYFSDDSIRWGSINTDRDSNDKNTWRIATIDEGFHSFPTKNITLSSNRFSNERKLLPPKKSEEEILLNAGIFKESFERELNSYGDLAKRFLPDYLVVKEFDVDNDGKNETIIGLCGGGNHCPYKVVIIKDDMIIFSTNAGAIGAKITEVDTTNGFYIEWAPWLTDGSKWDTGLCCMPGYMKTRFVYENDTFIPVYEQEVLYFKVENTE